MVASEQEGSICSEEHFHKTDQDLISYMLSSVLSLPQDEKDKKVKCLDHTSATAKYAKNGFLNQNLTCLMAGTDGGSWDAEQLKE